MRRPGGARLAQRRRRRDRRLSTEGRAAIPAMARGRSLARGQGGRRFARDLRRGVPRRQPRLEHAGAGAARHDGRGATRRWPGRVRQPRRLFRRGPACRPRRRRPPAACQVGTDACRDREALRRLARHRGRRLGAGIGLWPRPPPLPRGARARDRGLHGQAQGALSRRADRGAEDPPGGRRSALEHEELVGRRPRPAAIAAVAIPALRGRFRRRRPPRHLELGAGQPRLDRQLAEGAGLERRTRLGRRGARAARRRLHARGARAGQADERVGQARRRPGQRHGHCPSAATARGSC